ncbi:AI-2E family transporter [Alloyangia pacifica]|uniref:Predicted PurR-regulated permease PerM n=1 Tax=Alloyangia pacifica TaxID=311180 RepID=A0A1I6RU94_9RHOB|nr:AI-2E family transporter [Alloyangia pacifica]SDG61104.1 Predicted PurR-regulated permease PerM [Alloyangia pacifica]SFS68242.1 Predicted PurR-regulated permease PerM [Alloyangia pacifica]
MKSAQVIAPDWFKIIVGLPFVILLLWLGQDLFKLLAVAFLIFILATAFTDRLSRVSILGHRFSGWQSHALALAIFISVIWVFAAISSTAAGEIVEALPRYQERLGGIAVKLESLLGPRLVEALHQALDGLQVGDLVVFLAGGLVGSIAQVSLLTIYFVFLVLERSDWQKKVAMLSSPDPHGADFAVIVRRAAIGIKNFMWVNAVTSAMSGAVAYVVFRLIGLDFASFLAIMIFFVGFIPNIGAFIGILLPSFVALAQFDSLWPLVAVIVIYGGADQVISNVITPMMQGKSLNMSIFMITVSLVFWSLLWGGLGAFLAVPLTVIVMVVASEVPSLRWLAVLLSKDGQIDHLE